MREKKHVMHERENIDKYIKDKEFAEGSMLPKVEACIDFASKSSGYAVITSLKKAKAAINGKAGTIISKN